jgi:tRNA threonylcarbamoyladenosine biosynthesis protein TsaE
LLIRNENEMRRLGARLLAACEHGGVITLKGELGTGKTTLVRGALESEGVTGGVRSPTYTLVEYYPLERFTVVHFDLYRRLFEPANAVPDRVAAACGRVPAGDRSRDRTRI